MRPDTDPCMQCAKEDGIKSFEVDDGIGMWVCRKCFKILKKIDRNLLKKMAGEREDEHSV